MKKVLLLAVILGFTANAFALFGRCNGCKTYTNGCPAATVAVTREAKPVCYKMVRKEACPREVCEKICHFECPEDTIREEA